MKRKLVSVFLTLAMMLSIAPLGAVTAYAANVGDTFTENNSEGVAIKYKVTDAVNLTVEVEANSYYAATINIPATASDGAGTSYSVTSIGDVAFNSCTGLTGVTIPAGVRSIGGGAFGGCTGLTGVTIPASVTSIGDSAFYQCTCLGGSVTIPAGVTTIGRCAFGGCTNLAAINVDAGNASFASVDGVLFDHSKSTLLAFPNAKESSYTIPASVTSIGNYAFAYCTSLTGVTIPAGVTSIGNYAFYGCTSLTGVTIPASVRSIGDSAFYGCTSLAAITVDAGNTCFASVDGVLFDNGKSTLLAYPNAKGTSYRIPTGITSIGEYAFDGCTSLTSVMIPVGVTSIGYRAFDGCTGLTSVYFDGDEPSTIGIYAFHTNTTTTLYYNSNYTDYPATIDSQSCVGKTAYAVTVDPGITNGMVTSSAENGIPGETITLTVAPASGYALKTLTCTSNNATITGNSYFTMPDAAVTVSAAFAKVYTVAFDKNGGGTAASPASATVIDGGTAALPTTNPTRTGYTFAGWNTAANGSGTAFTVSTPVTGDFTVYAKWTANSTGGDDDLSYTITSSAGTGGDISPNGSVSVAFGGSKTYTITPTDGYEIKDVLVDGVSVGAVSSYTFENVKKAHTISASFAKKETVNPFADVKGGDWFYNSVMYVHENGIMTGTDSNMFSPNAAMTRQMIWMVLARMDGKAPASMDEAKAWAVEDKISDGTNPGNSITREQLAAILYRYAQYKGYDTTQGGMAIREFTDYDGISEYAMPALGWAVNAGLMQGSGNQIMPFGTAARAQVATILMRFIQNVVK